MEIDVAVDNIRIISSIPSIKAKTFFSQKKKKENSTTQF